MMLRLVKWDYVQFDPLQELAIPVTSVWSAVQNIPSICIILWFCKLFCEVVWRSHPLWSLCLLLCSRCGSDAKHRQHCTCMGLLHCGHQERLEAESCKVYTYLQLKDKCIHVGCLYRAEGITSTVTCTVDTKTITIMYKPSTCTCTSECMTWTQALPSCQSYRFCHTTIKHAQCSPAAQSNNPLHLFIETFSQMIL